MIWGKFTDRVLLDTGGDQVTQLCSLGVLSLDPHATLGVSLLAHMTLLVPPWPLGPQQSRVRLSSLKRLGDKMAEK